MDKIEQLEILLKKIFDGGLTNDESASLQDILKDSKEARDRYLEYCQIHAVLNENAGVLASVPTLTEKPKAPVNNFKWMLIAAAAILLISLTPLFIKKQPVTVVEKPHRGDAVAVVSKAAGVDFAYGGKNGSIIKEGDQIPTGVYSLTRGVMQIDYPNGASAVIEAPCDFEVISGMNLGCREGKISALVPQSARNFTISGAGVSVVDLGTEFSVHVVKGKFLEAHVFDGEVEINMHYEVGDQKYLVSEGQAVRVLMGDSGPVMAGVDLKHDFFIRQMTEPDSEYAKKILSKEPVAYYPMDISSDGRTLRDWSKYKNDGVAADVKEVANLFSAGKIGSALKLSGSNHKAYLFVEDYPKTENGRLSVVGWVYAESRPIWATIMKNWGNEKYGQFHFGLDAKGFLDVEIADKNVVRPHITDSAKFPIKRWVHVAFVHDGETVKVFRDGVVVASDKVDGINFPVELKKMSIGTKLGDTELFPAPGTPGHWDGRLDELAVFNKALTDAEIIELYETGK